MTCAVSASMYCASTWMPSDKNPHPVCQQICRKAANYWKNSIGMNKAIIDNDVLGTKAKQEKNFAEFAKGKTEYEGVVERIDEIIAKRMPVTRQFNYLYEALSGAIEFGSRT